MDDLDPHLTQLFLALLMFGFVTGFAAGYGIRAAISYRRRALAKRRRFFY